MSYLCEICGAETKGEPQRRGPICFACHIKTVSIGFTYGKSDFHGPTIAERQRKTVEDARVNGYNAEPMGSRWV